MRISCGGFWIRREPTALALDCLPTSRQPCGCMDLGCYSSRDDLTLPLVSRAIAQAYRPSDKLVIPPIQRLSWLTNRRNTKLIRHSFGHCLTAANLL
jgi:hypothetical protein